MMRRLLRSSLFLPCLATVPLFLCWAWLQRWVGDDGFINLRVVSQILDGHGFGLNTGERVEAVTSPLWVGLLTLAGVLGAPLTHAAVWLGLLLSAAGLCLAIAASLHRLPADKWSVPLGALIYACVPASWDYATSALENGLSMAWIGGTFLASMRAASLPASAMWRTAWIVGLGPLVRPDLGLMTAALGALHLAWALRTSPRDIATTLLSLVAPAAAFQIFRMGYFGALVPNTALAKEAFDARWEQGSFYLTNTFSLYQLWFPLAVVVVMIVLVVVWRNRQGQRREAAVTLALAASGLAHILYVVRVGGDFMHARMLLPGLFALTAAVAAFQPSFFQGILARLTAVGLVPVLAWAAWCAGYARVAEENEHGIGDERGWHARQAQVENPIEADDYVKFFFHSDVVKLKQEVAAHCPSGLAALEPDSRAPCERVVLVEPLDGRRAKRPTVLPMADRALPSSVVGLVLRRPLGIASAVVGPRIALIDNYGLADPVGSHLEVVKRGRPGHEKQLSSAWIAARFAKGDATTDRRFQSARRALRCGDLAELVKAARAPLTWSRFFRNLTMAPRLHGVRVPPDPLMAERKFCGT